MIEAPVTIVLDVRRHPDADRLTIVTVRGAEIDVPPGAAQVPFETHEVVANLDDEGNPRWRRGDWVAYIPEKAVVPEDVLKERGYWNEEKNQGYLGGSKGNRVKMQRFAGFESRGIIFAADMIGGFTEPRLRFNRGAIYGEFSPGDDTADFFGLTEYTPA